MSKVYIYSTLTSPQVYQNYRDGENGLKIPTSSVRVNGGANMMTKALVTPHGTVTEVTAEELADMRQNEVFNLHEKNGFITVSENKKHADDVAADMVTRDQSAPLVEQDELVPAPSEDKPKRRG